MVYLIKANMLFVSMATVKPRARLLPRFQLYMFALPVGIVSLYDYTQVYAKYQVCGKVMHKNTPSLQPRC